MLADSMYQQTIAWGREGKGFQIKDQKQFTKNVLSKYFRHSNLPSFVRQLNMYGFHKVKEDSYQFYMHPYFCKQQPQLSKQISRKPQKKLIFSQEELKNSENNSNFIKSQLKLIQTVQDKPKEKKVRFMEILTETKANHSSTSLKQSHKQIIQRPSLVNLIGNSEATIFNCEDFQDGFSICDKLIVPSIKGIGLEGEEQIFWTPSAMSFTSLRDKN